ncbi:MAG: MFS transporter [Clostridia bacterium]|nr:MFS transporter [Clostridia bacterium]
MSIKKEIKSYLQIPFTTYIILLSTIINRIGGFVGPFITLFLAKELGFTDTQTGLVVSFNAAVGMIGILLGGRIIDTIGSKYTRIIFHGLHGVLYILCVYVPNPLLIPLLALASFSSGIQAPSGSTLIIENTEEKHRKSAFSMNYIAINIGFTIGPLIAAFLFDHYLNWLFIGDGLSSFLSVLMIFIFVPSHQPQHTKNKHAKAEHNRTTWSILKENPHLIKFLTVIVLLFIAFSQSGFAVPLTAKHVLGDKATATYGMTMFLNGVLCTFVTPIITILTKQMKPTTALGLNGLLYTIGFGMFAFVKTPLFFLVGTFIWTIGEILGATNTDVYIASHAPESHRGRINALPPLMRRAGFIVGPILAGIISDQFGILSVWYIVSCFALLGSLLLFTSRDRKSKKENMAA